MSGSIHNLTKSYLNNLLAAKANWSKRCLFVQRASGFRALASASGPQPDQNVVGVGVGEKMNEGRPTGIFAVKFLVRRKYPEDALAKKDLLPKFIDGLPVDVEESGLLRPQKTAKRKKAVAQAVGMPDPKRRFRPSQPGCSVGFQSPAFRMAGTFGALVKDSAGTYILSNNHVLANEGGVQTGDPIFQPGLLDGGVVPGDDIATLTRFVPLQTGALNKVDGAIAKANSASVVSKDILHIGAPAGTTAAQVDMRVHKFGRTTSYTVGRVTSIATDVTVPYEAGNMVFEDQIIIVGDNGSFSAAGDSGSLILERTSNKAIGLLFAGSPTHTVANHIADVLSQLRVTLA